MGGRVRLQLDGPLARVTLSHPGKFNAMSRAMWKEISISTPIMCIALPSKRAGEGTSAPARRGAGFGSAVGVRAPTFQPATGPVAAATPS